MWFGFENMLVAYADDATLLAVVTSPNKRSVISNSLNKDLILLLSLKPDCNPDWRAISYIPKGTSRENSPVRKRKICRRKFYKF